MKLLTTLALVGGGAAYYWHRRNARSRGLGATGDRGHVPASSVRAMATDSGIAQVDPEPLSQIVEAQDPDATQRAHTELRDLHDKLPR